MGKLPHEDLRDMLRRLFKTMFGNEFNYIDEITELRKRNENFEVVVLVNVSGDKSLTFVVVINEDGEIVEVKKKS